jgi:ABC-2 type transport system permease protein
MNRIWLVFKHELYLVLARPFFWLAVIGLPLLSFFTFRVAADLGQGRSNNDVLTNFVAGAPSQAAEGYVDASGLLQALPDPVLAERLVAYPDEAAALQALHAGKISAYYLIPANVVERGFVTYVRTDFSLAIFDPQGSALEQVLQFNLLGGNATLDQAIRAPLVLEEIDLSPELRPQAGGELAQTLPLAICAAFYITFTTTAGLLFGSLYREKDNDLLELLLAAINSRQLLVGKVLAQGLLSLFQTLLWFGMGNLLLAFSGGRLGSSGIGLPAGLEIPPALLGWGIVFFLLGYACYACLIASLGALGSYLREAYQIVLLCMAPIFAPLLLVSVLTQAPNSPLAVGLSLFPLTAPAAMLTRLAVADVPLWQLLLAAGLLLASSVLTLQIAARLFRAQALLAGQPAGVKALAKALLDR